MLRAVEMLRPHFWHIDFAHGLTLQPTASRVGSCHAPAAARRCSTPTVTPCSYAAAVLLTHGTPIVPRDHAEPTSASRR